MKLESSIWINLKDIIFKIIFFYLFLVTNYFRKDDIYAQKEDDKSKKFLDQLQRLKIKLSKNQYKNKYQVFFHQDLDQQLKKNY